MLSGSLMASPQKVVERRMSPEKTLPENIVTFKDKKIKPRHQSSSLPTRAEGDGPYVTPIITDPQGNAVQYLKESAGITYNWMLGTYIYQGSNPSTVVWDGDNVYIKDIISDFDTKAYVKGTISGNKITVDLPQTIAFDEDMEFGYNVAMLKIDYYYDPDDDETYIDYILDDSITSVDLIMGENGYFYMDIPGDFDWEDFPDYAIGIVYTDVDPYYDGAWVGYCDFFQEYSVFEMEANQIPEGLAMETYSALNEEVGFGYIVNVGFDEDTVYFKGLSYFMPEGVTIGKMSPNTDGTYTIKIAQDQYMGLFEDVYFVFTKAVMINPDYDEDDPDSMFAILAPEDVEIELIYDPVAKSFTYAESPYYLCLNTSLSSLYYIEVFEEINLTYQASAAGTPKDPENLVFIPFAQYYGYDVFDFTIPNLSTDDNILDLNNLYYSIYVDGEIMEFMEEEGINSFGYEIVMYEGITEPTTVLPLTFSNGNDIWSSDNMAEIGIYFEGFTTLGVQTIYMLDGVTTKSGIVELNVETGEVSSVDSLNLNDSSVKSIEFYDLNGRRVKNPDKGIYIMKSVLENGSVITKKVVKR